jgi:hypothetical protein
MVMLGMEAAFVDVDTVLGPTIHTCFEVLLPSFSNTTRSQTFLSLHRAHSNSSRSHPDLSLSTTWLQRVADSRRPGKHGAIQAAVRIYVCVDLRLLCSTMAVPMGAIKGNMTT